MKEYRTPLDLTKKLVSLPSFVDDKQDETPLADFLTDFARQALPDMAVRKQYVEEGSPRYNVILQGKNSPKLLVLGHLDTVQPKAGWQTDPLEPVVKDDKLYGLGSADMKGATAAFLWALVKEQQNIALDDLMVLLYVDEEYDFLGMKRFIRDEETAALAPEMVVSMDGMLDVNSGCRGLIELKLLLRGQSGHASNPGNGVNAITGSIAVIADLEKELEQYGRDDMGTTTLNVAAIEGGCLSADGQWLKQGNIIPDSAEVILEVRPAVPEVNARFVQEAIERLAKGRGLQVTGVETRHDITPWQPGYNQKTIRLLESVYKQAGVPLVRSERAYPAYIDAQMVAEKLQSPTFMIGASNASKHGANEYLLLEDLEKSVAVYTELLRQTLQ